ncbi:MAG: protoheme IX farnesyltransferase [bacterium]|nr:protoheme IX farnesyltransferase [bacterium]
MVVLTTAAGYLLTAPRPIDWLLLCHAMLGTALVASGASALNQVIERHTDARMRRTANRPIPAGRLDVERAFAFGLMISLVGVVYLTFLVNPLTAVIGALTLASYVLIYTPLKRRSSLSTIVGAVPGAAPPVMGVTAATGELGVMAWILFGILFLWQMPHFLAIAWMYRADYERGGFPLLTLGHLPGQRTARQMVLYAAALIPVSVLPSVLGYAGALYFVGALVLGLLFLGFCFAFGKTQDARAARRLLLVSVIYLPVVLLLMVADQALL